MELSQFEAIFLWEYLHRLLGRLVGVVFALPFLYFLVRGRLRGRAAGLTLVAFLLGGAQGLLGWYMVASGLVDVPEVSHYRLAAHLTLAFVTGMYALWLVLELRPAPSPAPPPASGRFRTALGATLGLMLLQIVYGAFMAGTRAGHVSATWPDMNGHYGPGPFFRGDSVLDDLLTSPAAIHWTHRTLAYLLVIAIASCLALAWREGPRVRRAAGVLAGAVLVQLALGVGVVLASVPIWLAVTHQAGAYLLLAVGTWLAWEAGLLPRGVIAPSPEAEAAQREARTGA